MPLYLCMSHQTLVSKSLIIGEEEHLFAVSQSIEYVLVQNKTFLVVLDILPHQSISVSRRYKRAVAFLDIMQPFTYPTSRVCAPLACTNSRTPCLPLLKRYGQTKIVRRTTYHYSRLMIMRKKERICLWPRGIDGVHCPACVLKGRNT